METTNVPDDFVETFVYDDGGRLVRHTSFEERVKTSVYDAQTGRLVEELFFENPDSYARFVDDIDGPDETWSYKYNAFGRQVEATQNDGVTVRTTATTYDGEGRTASITSPEGVLHYEYDDLGRKTRTYTTDPADPLNVTNDTRYTYDALGRLQTVEVYERNDQPLGTPESTSYQYDLVGNLDLQTNPNGIVADYDYDELNRLDKLTHLAPDGDPLAEFDYTVREDGRREKVSEKRWDANDQLVSDLLFEWTYDDLGRLTDEVFTDVGDLLADLDDYRATYTYDLAGNRTEKTLDKGNDGLTDGDETITYTYDKNDRLLTETKDVQNGTDSSTTYGYGLNNASTVETRKEVSEGGVLVSSPLKNSG